MWYNVFMQIQKDIPIAPKTVFKVGGVARFFAEAKSGEGIIELIEWAKKYKLPFFLLGAGSNTLVRDSMFPGLVIKPIASDTHFIGNSIVVDAGAMMPYVANRAAAQGLSGFEWAVGIPGTIGGSVRGNAGCFGKSMADVIESVEVYDAILQRKQRFSNRDCKFAYRESKFKKSPELIILSAKISLVNDHIPVIRARMKECIVHRLKTQAIGEKCAGCIFKNIPWDDVSFVDRERLLKMFPRLAEFRKHSMIPTALILEDLGLKGLKMGNALVSPKHSNFFVNTGSATSHEIAILISHCKEYVHRKTGILLQEEIHYL